MSVKASSSIWFGDGYGVEFIITDPFTIDFHVILEKDPTMISTENFVIGADTCHRGVNGPGLAAQLVNGEVPASEETMRDFAGRARLAGISFAEGMIAEHKETQELSTVLVEVLKSFARADPITKQ